MFWGLVLKPEKTYSSVVRKSFHLSMAALDSTSYEHDDPSTQIYPVLVKVDGVQFIVCNLSQSALQVNLDLVFKRGSNITFSTSGQATIHLTGYRIKDDFTYDYPGYVRNEFSESSKRKESIEARRAALERRLMVTYSSTDDSSGDSSTNSSDNPNEDRRTVLERRLMVTYSSTDDSSGDSSTNSSHNSYYSDVGKWRTALKQRFLQTGKLRKKSFSKK
ncbi:46 kDa FK506-binding nuclear protein-like [Planococcus citri]|uniref:46 kDa FK506-binding nuclear protein-like n=1 Tax=Planococcus citri TaxID=170843 RepID=UPI0031F9827C